MKNKLTRNWPYFVIGAGALMAVGVTASSAGFKPGMPSLPGTPAFMTPVRTSALSSTPGMTELRNLNDTFAEISASISPSVVQIQPRSQGGQGGMNGSGSGFIYRADGWIVTNDHVVNGQSEVKVVMHDGREYTGKVYAANDPQIDLAVVKIEANDLQTLALGDMRNVRPGQFTLAVGSPFGLESTVTVGHVSALNRPGQVFDPRIGTQRSYAGMIQTDAAINPGNSGGPLLNIDGEVIGVNSTINTLTGASAGVGFAIPSTTVKVVADELINTKKFDRGFLGVEFDTDIKPYQLKELGIEGGAKVAGVPEDGPSYKAGLRANDIILQVDNDKVNTSNDLLLTMYRRSPGDSVSVRYLRGGKVETASVKLSDMTATMRERSQPQRSMPQQRDPRELFREFGPDVFRNFEEDGSGAPVPEGKPRLGVSIDQIGETQKRQFGLTGDIKGVVVTTVAPDSVAEKFGLRPGDVITQIQSNRIETPQDVTKALEKIQWQQNVTIKTIRFKDGQRQESTVSMPFAP